MNRTPHEASPDPHGGRSASPRRFSGARRLMLKTNSVGRCFGSAGRPKTSGGSTFRGPAHFSRRRLPMNHGVAPLRGSLLRKEVIQPQVPLRLPCYDFIPVTSFTLGPCDTSGATGFHDVTGGVYKTRERIHGTVADVPLLAIPASWRRVAASNPNWAQFFGFPPPRGFGSNCTGHCSTCAAQGVRAILT